MELLNRLTQTNGVSGHERAIRNLIRDEAAKYCDDVRTDALGNLIAHKKGNGKKIMFAAHMDEIGIIVKSIDENGFIRFAPIGGLYVKNLVYKRVEFGNGTIGVIGSEEENFEKKADISKLYIDIGAKDENAAKEKVSVGSTAAFCGEFRALGKNIISKAMDNRIGCFVLLEAMKKIKNSENDLYFVFTSQEEVGLRGAKTAAFDINPDFAVAVDVTDTGDTPESPAMAVKLGNGAAIKIMDRSIMCDSDVRTHMLQTAKRNKIPHQLEVMTDGGTDAGAIHLTRAGVKTGGISIPARYIHSPSEMVNVDDVLACIDMISALSCDKW